MAREMTNEKRERGTPFTAHLDPGGTPGATIQLGQPHAPGATAAAASVGKVSGHLKIHHGGEGGSPPECI